MAEIIREADLLKKLQEQNIKAVKIKNCAFANTVELDTDVDGFIQYVQNTDATNTVMYGYAFYNKESFAIPTAAIEAATDEQARADAEKMNKVIDEADFTRPTLLQMVYVVGTVAYTVIFHDTWMDSYVPKK